MDWYQIFVNAPGKGVDEEWRAIKRVDEHLVTEFGISTLFEAPPPDGVPIQNKDGMWVVRVQNRSILDLVRFILTKHYGFEIVRKVAHRS